MSETVEMILDKGLLALVLALFSFGLSRILARYQRDQSVFAELARLRSKSLVDAFNLLSEYESKVQAILVHKVKEQTGEAIKVNSIASELYDNIVSFVDANRFLLGEEMYRLCQEFAKLQTIRIKACDVDNYELLKKTDVEISKIRKDVQKYLPSLRMPD